MHDGSHASSMSHKRRGYRVLLVALRKSASGAKSTPISIVGRLPNLNTTTQTFSYARNELLANLSMLSEGGYLASFKHLRPAASDDTPRISIRSYPRSPRQFPLWPRQPVSPEHALLFLQSEISRQHTISSRTQSRFG